MKTAIKIINEFNPSCEQEEVDKKMFLDIANNISNPFSRDCLVGHFTVSAWVMNETMDKVLCCHHNIYNAWTWLGGHCDGDDNFLEVIKREITEESGIKKFHLFHNDLISLESLPVGFHTKNEKYVPSHTHWNVTYAFIADEKCEIEIAHEENSDVAWKTFDELIQLTPSKHNKIIFQKIIDRVKTLSIQL